VQFLEQGAPSRLLRRVDLSLDNNGLMALPQS